LLEAEAAGLAMLALFGCPHLDRVPVHQLHPSGVHAAGHGRHYGVALAAAAEAVLALEPRKPSRRGSAKLAGREATEAL
jgi:hypothetical protein